VAVKGRRAAISRAPGGCTDQTALSLGEHPGEQRDDFGPDLLGRIRTPSEAAPSVREGRGFDPRAPTGRSGRGNPRPRFAAGSVQCET
jgi:hypothetical protein